MPLPFSRLRYAEPDAITNVIETHEHAGEFKRVLKKFRRSSLERKKRMAALKLNSAAGLGPQLRRRLGYTKIMWSRPWLARKIRSRARSLLIVLDHLRRKPFARWNQSLRRGPQLQPVFAEIAGLRLIRLLPLGHPYGL